MYNIRDIGFIFKSMSMHKRDRKGIVKPYFIISCLTFRDSILIEDEA